MQSLIPIGLIFNLFSSEIHPLALEDVLHQRSTQSRSKADYYFKHLFIRVLCHRLGEEDSHVSHIKEDVFTDIPRSSSPAPFTDEDSWEQDDKLPANYEEDLGSSTSTAFSALKLSKLTQGSLRKKKHSTMKRDDLELGSIPRPAFRSATRLRLVS